MTEQEKDEMLSSIAERAAIAERSGLANTAKSWRDLYAVVLLRPVEEIIFANRIMDKPANPV